mgnify:CR=1 FL=1
MKEVIKNSYKVYKDDLSEVILEFDSLGRNFGNQDRNALKLFDLPFGVINVKSFKIPNLVNKIAYRFFRKSKAQRSYEYANILKSKGIGTPEPIAYYEFQSLFFFGKSFYVSQQIDCDYTYRELTTDFSIPNYETILRQFTRFTFQLHEQEINFLDHSPGNTLIKRTTAGYEFFLVDLNRMKFGPLTFEERIKNFAKLTIHKSMIEVMSDEYAKCIQRDYNEVFDLMWASTLEFQERFHRRKRIKKKLKFWKNH